MASTNTQTRQPIAPRPRRGTGSFSFHSDKSNKSNRQSVARASETSAEKESHRLHSKADPTMAMNEAEPSYVAATERSMLAPLRSIQHKDMFGNPIAEPDRSNPTRSRWERPLDTIRSFEAAIDGPSGRGAAPSTRPGSEMEWNRRGSYYASRTNVPSRPPSIYSMAGNIPRYPQDAYYGNRSASQLDLKSSPGARDSYHEMSQQGSYTHNNGGGGYGGYNAGNGGLYPGRQNGSRPPQNAQYNQNQRDPNGVYPIQHRDRSYETVTSAASGSGSGGDQGSYRTDPSSSDNNSLNRASPPKPSPPTNDYGIGFNGAATYQPAAFSVGAGGNAARSTIQKKPVPGAMAGNPPVPPKSQALGSSAQEPEAGKRKSWLFRRFSKKA
ncbi:uncharacterized protein DNG_00478 [Cephalotrichum gorgonifer]|uniref:Uncharacterized protein n=1 Tax=Cephalotrichum gorgonifer TaxID=2041049 RepID=A0AAE8MQ16_9PEZI|nr:uncharacterized protein DNG_00478 [Cephalotrichum gorgonifer]